MIYELTSKKTGKVSVVDQETYETLKENGSLKKYTIAQVHKPKTVVPEEIIVKRKIKPEINEG